MAFSNDCVGLIPNLRYCVDDEEDEGAICLHKKSGSIIRDDHWSCKPHFCIIGCTIIFVVLIFLLLDPTITLAIVFTSIDRLRQYRTGRCLHPGPGRSRQAWCFKRQAVSWRPCAERQRLEMG
jgi:hypothetical protein